MSKNAEGWIRHRGGKCPVEAGVKVDYRMRNGEIDCFGHDAGRLQWNHEPDDGDIMAYRLHKPAEQVEPFIEAVHAFNALAKVQQLDGPIGWRDRITEIDVEVQARTVERAELVQKLASEGFALIGRINDLLTDAAQKHENIGDPKKWKVGDELEAIGDCGGFSFAGEVVKILVVRDDGGFEVATESDPDYGWFFTEEESITDLKFHSRPSN